MRERQVSRTAFRVEIDDITHSPRSEKGLLSAITTRRFGEPLPRYADTAATLSCYLQMPPIRQHAACYHTMPPHARQFDGASTCSRRPHARSTPPHTLITERATLPLIALPAPRCRCAINDAHTRRYDKSGAGFSSLSMLLLQQLDIVDADFCALKWPQHDG